MDQEYEEYTMTLDEFTDIATRSDWTSAPTLYEDSFGRQTFFTQTYAYNLFILIINFSIIFFNGVVIYIVARYREVRSTVTLCFMNLAITDIFYVLAQTSSPLKITSGFDLKAALGCNVMTYLHYATVTATALTMTFLAFDRYWVISRPIVSLKNRSYTKVMLSFVAVWTLSFALHSYIPVIREDVGHYCKNVYQKIDQQKGEKIFHTFKALVNYVFPVTLSGIFYARIYVILRRLPPGAENCSKGRTGSGPHSLRNRRLRGIRVAVMVLVLYAVCYLPATTLSLWRAWDPNFPTDRFHEYHLITGLFAKICIFLNPFLYSLSAPSFQTKILKLTTCCRTSYP